MAEGRRLFFALWPEPELQFAMARTGHAIARERALGGREIPAELIHLTLLFLGDVSPDTEERLVAAAGQIRGHSFHLALQRASCFYRTRVFWLGPTATPPRLTALWKDLQAVAAASGVEPDSRPLVPHVTCVRDIRHRIKPVPMRQILWPVREFVLVHSALGSPPQYHVVSHWPLQTARA